MEVSNCFRHVVITVCAEAERKVSTVAFVITVPVVVNVTNVIAVIVGQNTLEVKIGKFVNHVVAAVSQARQESPLKMGNLSQCLSYELETEYKQV